MAAIMNPTPSLISGAADGAPRLWTPPARDLAEPGASYGPEVIEFARDVLGAPLDPWQQWLVLHAGELLDDGRPRFRQILAIVARQNGKTHLLTVLALFWLFVDGTALIVGTSTNRDTAKESWVSAVDQAEGSRWLAPQIANINRTNGSEALRSVEGARYRPVASNRRGGRGMTVGRLIMDELREHRTWDAWHAAVPATNAVPDAQVWAISNQGDDTACVLNTRRSIGLATIANPDPSGRVALFEWSAVEGAQPDDPVALAAANPNAGRRLDLADLVADARAAMAEGGEVLAGFRTEILCQKVSRLDPAVDPDGWAECADPHPIDLAAHRRRLAMVVDLAVDGSHATAAVAAVVGGMVHVEIIGHWNGIGCGGRMRADLPGLVGRVRPRVFGWMPSGPAAAVAADLAERRGWPPRGVEAAEIRGEVTAVAMGLAELVQARALRHPADPLLDAHIAATERQWRGDAWSFARRGKEPIDAAYACAGAIHLARLIPAKPADLAVV